MHTRDRFGCQSEYLRTEQGRGFYIFLEEKTKTATYEENEGERGGCALSAVRCNAGGGEWVVGCQAWCPLQVAVFDRNANLGESADDGEL